MYINNINTQTQKGISLIELIIFITIISIALTSISLVYIQATRHSADPMVRIRSIELAQSMLEEILLKAYDGNTPVGGGCVKMSDPLKTRCTSTNDPSSDPDATSPTKPLGAEEGSTNRLLFNDVDDYHNLSYCGTGGTPYNLCSAGCQDLTDSSGTPIKDLYAGYAICVQVSYAGKATDEINNVNPVAANPVLENDAKRIDVYVTDPLNTLTHLSSYRLNY